MIVGEVKLIKSPISDSISTSAISNGQPAKGIFKFMIGRQSINGRMLIPETRITQFIGIAGIEVEFEVKALTCDLGRI